MQESPQLSDFDQGLQDYKQQVRDELKQKITAAGVTMEEEIASDSASPSQPSFSIYQVLPGLEGRDFDYRPYEELQSQGLSVERQNVPLIYTAALDQDATLDVLYRH